MSDHPILFKGWGVKAIQADTKTQTRRVAVTKYPKGCDEFVVDRERCIIGFGSDGFAESLLQVADAPKVRTCPYGVPGDRLWVRETFAPRSDVDPAVNPSKARHYCLYRASGGDPRDEMNYHDYGGRWHPSIFMPRALSRITLEVLDVRVERVQDMGFYDWVADFVPTFHEQERALATFVGAAYQREHSKALWDSINAKRGYGWDVNPWTWAVTFRRVEAATIIEAAIEEATP